MTAPALPVELPRLGSKLLDQFRAGGLSEGEYTGVAGPATPSPRRSELLQPVARLIDGLRRHGERQPQVTLALGAER